MTSISPTRDAFNGFRKAFPSVEDTHRPIEGAPLARQVHDAFGIAVPELLVDFWSQIGGGYFADRELYVFTDADDGPRHSLVAWNSLDVFRSMFPRRPEGPPVFFAETCCGMQLGFHWEDGNAVACLLDIESFEMFRAAETMHELFASILCDRYALVDPELLPQLKERLGLLPDGMHYAPIVSPLLGGSMRVENHDFEPARVHLEMSHNTWASIDS